MPNSWPANLPIWRTDYKSTYSNAVVRSQLRGRKTQRQISQRESEIVNVSLNLTADNLALFEYFALEVLNDCTDIFTGSYWDNGVQTGNLRFVGGYNVQAENSRVWNVIAQVEVLR